MVENNKPILFFDGHCNLCNGMIDFLVRRDPKTRVLIASLQGKTAAAKLPQDLREEMSSIVLLNPDGSLFVKTSAVFKLAWTVGGLLLLVVPFWIIPRPITNWVYDRIAASRYSLFGRRDTCRIPTEDENKHFLE